MTSLPITWGHVTWFPVTWLPPPASYSLVWSQTHSIRLFSAFYSHFQMTSGQMTSLPGHFCSPEVTRRHFLSHDCLLLRATVLYKVKRTVYASFRPSTVTSKWLPMKGRDLRVTSAHLRSRDVISCNVTASTCELQPCMKSKPSVRQISAYSQFQVTSQSNDSSGSLPVTWGHVTSFPVMWLPPPATYSLVGSQTQNAPVFGILQSLPGDFRSNDVTSRSLPVTWGHVTSLPVMWLPPPASNSNVGSQTHSICQLSAFYSHFQETSGQMTSLPSYFRSPEVTWCHFLSCVFLLLQATAL